MKVVFLDIDGVLNSNSFLISSPKVPDVPATVKESKAILRVAEYVPDDYSVQHLLIDLRSIDPRNVGPLNDLLQRSGARVVISSSWRITLPWKAVQSILRYHGFKGQVIGATPAWVPNAPSGERRGYEIKTWLSEHTRSRVSRFVILDDDRDMGPLKKFLVKPDAWDGGLKQEHVEKALLLLGG